MSQSFFSVGQRLTDYANFDMTVVRTARGGFGEVAMGPNRALGGQWSAIKVLRPDVLAGGDAHVQGRLQELFLREALTWKGLWPHPNLLTAQFVTRVNSQVALVLDYAEKGSLRQRFEEMSQRGTWFTIASALELAQQIAAGLVALHTPAPELLRDKPIIHRDLKPENILLDESEDAMITDFGLAKALTDVLTPSDPGQSADAGAPRTTDATLPVESAREAPQPVADGRAQVYRTLVGAALGTPAYMAPEQWHDAAIVQEPADAYAFGIILAELLTGKHPLLPLDQPHTLARWRQAHEADQPIPLRQLGGDVIAAQLSRAGVPEALERVGRLLRRLLVKQADARPSMVETASELGEAAVALGRQPYIPSEDVYPRTHENETMFWRGWATAYDNFGLREQALPRIERALALAPSDPKTLTSYGAILAGLGRGDEAVARYHRTLAALPASETHSRSMLLNNLGAALNELGRHAEAEAAYAEQVELESGYADGWHNRANNERMWAEAEIAAGQQEEARTHAAAGLRHAERAVALNGDDPDFARLAQALRELRGQL